MHYSAAVDWLPHYLLFHQILCHLLSLSAKILLRPLAFIYAAFYSTMQLWSNIRCGLYEDICFGYLKKNVWIFMEGFTNKVKERQKKKAKPEICSEPWSISSSLL